jgi:hypothetical protein
MKFLLVAEGHGAAVMGVTSIVARPLKRDISESTQSVPII